MKTLVKQNTKILAAVKSDAKEGDIITLVGESDGLSVSINDWAKILGTINYELTCRLKARLSRVYTR